MYRVYITREMRKDAVTYLKMLDVNGIKTSLTKMRDKLTPVKSISNLNDYKNYLTDIINYYPLIQIMPPSFFERFLQSHPNISKLGPADLKIKFHSTGESKKSFSEMIVSRMRYDKEAKKFITPFLKKYGFRTCVYCNQSHIHYDSLDKTKKTATLDHFYHKDRYPFLCTSFFNLFPCCSDCNGPDKKAERQIGFFPYREDKLVKGSPFMFRFNIRGCAKYCNENDVDIDFFEDPNMGDLILYKSNVNLQKYDEIFQIRELYQDYKGKVSLAVQRKAFFGEKENNAVTQVSNNRLPKALSPEIMKLVLGVQSLNEEDIHKEELMKLFLDLGKKLET